MVLLNHKARRISDGEFVIGKLNAKCKKLYIDDDAVYPESVCQCTGMFDSSHELIYENDLIVHDDLVYRIVMNQDGLSFGKLLLFDMVRHTDDVIALKLHKPLIPIDKLANHVERMDRAFAWSSEIIGDIYTFGQRAQMIDVSKASGDKETYINKMINKARRKDG